MKRIIAAITALIMAIMLWAIAHAGTYRNISSTSQQYVTIAGTSGMVKPGENATTYQQLDILDPATWLRIDDEPYEPLTVYDQVVDIAEGSTATSISVDPNTSRIQLWNLSSAHMTVQLNSPINPYPAVLGPHTHLDEADYLEIINDKKVSVLYIKHDGTGVQQVKVRVIP